MSDQTPAQDHGPLAAPLSDRTLDKVLSRPAYVPRETPSLVELDRRDAASKVVEAALAWYDATPPNTPDAIEALDAAVIAYRAAVQS